MAAHKQAPDEYVCSSVFANGNSLDNEVRRNGPEKEAEVEYRCDLDAYLSDESMNSSGNARSIPMSTYALPDPRQLLTHKPQHNSVTFCSRTGERA